MNSYPHQLIGRAAAARRDRDGVCCRIPSLLLLDEPTTALDVTVEAGIVKLIADISKKFGTSQIYISHNLGLILETCDRVFVMYSGEVVEEGTIDSLFTWPSATPTPTACSAAFHCPRQTRMRPRSNQFAGQLPLPHERPSRAVTYGPRCDHFKGGQCATLSISRSTPNMLTGQRPGSLAFAACAGRRSTTPRKTPGGEAKEDDWNSGIRCSKSIT